MAVNHKHRYPKNNKWRELVQLITKKEERECAEILAKGQINASFVHHIWSTKRRMDVPSEYSDSSSVVHHSKHINHTLHFLIHKQTELTIGCSWANDTQESNQISDDLGNASNKKCWVRRKAWSGSVDPTLHWQKVMRASKSELIESESIIREKNMEHHILNIQSIHSFLMLQNNAHHEHNEAIACGRISLSSKI